MISKPAVIAVLAALCVAAAGGGAYLAVRQIGATPAVERSALTTAESESAAPAAVAPSAVTPATTTDTVVPINDNPTPAVARNRRPAPSSPSAREAHRAPRAATTAPARTPEQPPVTAPAPEPVPQPSTPTPFPEPPREGTAVGERLPEREPAPVPAARTFEELVVEADSVIGLQMETTLTTERARLEDRVEARVTREVMVRDRTAIPAGARMIGSVSLVEKGGKVRERARLGVRFHTLVLGDGTTLPVQTDTIFRDGDSPAGESAAKIGGAAVGGAILGAIFGGAKGAIIGGSTGAGGGTAAVMSGDRKPAVLTAGSSVTVRLSAPVTVTVEREQEPRL
ncbi:MAG: hypothetical protein ACRD1S_11775 [Vicinamibacterales bacterium]